MWPVPLVTAGLVGDLPGHGIILTTWNPAPEPSEGLVAEGKGLPETMPMPEPAMLLQLLFAPSPPWHVALVPLWPQSSSTRVGPGTSWLFTGTSVGVLAAMCFQAYTVAFALFVHQGIVFYCSSSVRGGHFVTRGQIMLWTGVQYCLHCLRTSRNYWGRTRTMTFFCWQYVLNVEDSNESFK